MDSNTCLPIYVHSRVSREALCHTRTCQLGWYQSLVPQSLQACELHCAVCAQAMHRDAVVGRPVVGRQTQAGPRAGNHQRHTHRRVPSATNAGQQHHTAAISSTRLHAQAMQGCAKNSSANFTVRRSRRSIIHFQHASVRGVGAGSWAGTGKHRHS